MGEVKKERAERIDEKVREILERKGLKAKEKTKDSGRHEPRRIQFDRHGMRRELYNPTNSKKRVVSWNVEDPVGKGDEVYEKVFNSISENIKTLLKEIEG